jgi:hypothetical protein
MTTGAAGLSFQEAFSEALAEEEVAASESPTPANVEPENQIASEVEQPAVETEEETGLFSSLQSEEGQLEQSSNEGLHEVTVDGEKQFVTLDELIAGYQRQAHYTQGRQELAQEREQNKNAITLWEALEKDYVGTVRQLMARTGLQPQAQQPVKQTDVDIDAIVEQKLQEKLASDPRIQMLEQEQSLRQLEIVFSDIEREYDLPRPLTLDDKQLILEKAQAWNTTDLGYVVYRLLQQKQHVDAQQRNVELVSTAQGRRSGAQEDYTPQVEYYSTVADAWKAALAEEGNL